MQYDALKTATEAYYYDTQAAERVVLFAENLCTHVKGKLARQPLILQDWQRVYLRTLFGWKHKETDYRRYRQSILEVARKNGKSTLAAIVGLYCLLCDNEQGAEIILAATTRDQASILYDIVAGMVNQNATLKGKVKILDSRKRIVYKKTNSYLAAISADAGSHHGLNAHCVIFDELHASPNRDLYDVLQTSQGARTQPLFLITTTAGYDRNSICYEVHNYGKQIEQGVLQDPTFLPAIYSAEDKADWTQEETWIQANPNYGVSIAKDYLAKECKKAQDLPAYQNTFRQLHLSQWTENKSAWLSLEHWRQCAVEDFPPLKGQVCYGGLDLSSTKDLSSFALAFPVQDKVYIKVWSWIPQDNAKEREDRDRVPYRLWAQDDGAQLTMTPGNVIDYAYIEQTITALASQYRIENISYDRWNATSIILNLQAEGLTMAAMGQGYASLSPVCKEWEARLLSHSLVHDNNPVLNWAIANVSILTDPAGNIKTCKPDYRASQKIDPVQAALMALSGVMGASRQTNVYDERGIVSF